MPDVKLSYRGYVCCGYWYLRDLDFTWAEYGGSDLRVETGLRMLEYIAAYVEGYNGA